MALGLIQRLKPLKGEPMLKKFKDYIWKTRLFCQFDRLANWVWERAAIPKLWTLTICFTYILLITGWVPAIFDPPNTLSSAFGIAVMYIIASTVVIGAISGVIAAFWGIFKVEVWSVLLVGTGILMYWCVVQGLHWYTEGNRLPQAQTVLALLPTFIARFVWVLRQPEANANELFVHRPTAD